MNECKFLKMVPLPCNYEEHPTAKFFCTRTGNEYEVWKRSCRKNKCPNYVEKNVLDEKDVSEYEEQAKRIILDPKKTIQRKDLFLKLFPTAQVEINDMPIGKVPMIRPCQLNTDYRKSKSVGCYDISCDICRRTFWNENVEE